MPDLDGGFFLLETGVTGTEMLRNSTVQRLSDDLEMGVECYIEPPTAVIEQGETAIGSWLAFLIGGFSADAIKQGGAIRFHITIGPSDPV